MEEALTKLQLLTNKQLTRIILWLIRDLINWKTDNRVIETKREHSALMLEALLHQINKENIDEEE